MSDVSLIYGNRKVNESYERKISIRMKKNEKTNNQKDHDNTEKLKLPIPISEFKKNDVNVKAVF